jgi:hypothetical protein
VLLCWFLADAALRFRSVTTPKAKKEKAVYLEDISPKAYVVKSFCVDIFSTANRNPACEVTKVELFDPMLQDTYKNLPPLR